ncbi:Ubiquitin-fold modifier-conjugating enzyme [Trema orientale]|uniref:Ubiquitin-fold modifier-conjugating enzyme n=1 Tax=Trema orientale TaxID=63057 RepID=A0A2P5EWQ0_TREOI|nr:Ubiquitin-fold modifier-conjugating enzyme [Trema orientale]
MGDESSNLKGSGDRNRNEGNCKSGPLPADQVRVLWIDQTESTQNINGLTVIDRGFLHGDFVAAASDPTGQVGVVVDVNMSVDLLAHDGSIVKDVSSKELKRVRDFTVGDYVVLGPWLGRIDDVLDNVTVVFDDGSVCKVMRAEPLRLKPLSKNILDDGHFPYYPGQRVRASSSSVFKNSRWLSGLWKANRLEGTVTKVTVGSVFIYWIASAGYGPDSSTAPAEEQNPKNLKLLSCFAHANWQLGDWCLFSLSTSSSSVPLEKGLSKLELHDSVNSELDSTQMGSVCDSETSAPEESNGNNGSMDLDVVAALVGPNGNNPSIGSNESSSCGSSLSVSKEPVHETRPLHRKKIRKVVVRRDKKARKKEESFERAVLIVNTRTKVDVAWQDGRIEHGLSSTNLIPIDSPGDHDFVAEQYVVEKASDDTEDACEARRVGVVKSVNAKEKTACIRWLKPVLRPEDPREFDKEEIVSVYELEGHPDYDYCYGDVVVRLSPVSISAEAAPDRDFIEEPKQQNGQNDVEEGLENCSGHEKVDGTFTDNNCEDFSDLSWVGNITGLKDGDIEVTWADGMVSTVGPQAIYVVGRDDDDDSLADASEVSDDAASWETVNDDEMDALENTKEEVELHNAVSHMISEAEESRENDSGRNPALSVPLAALRFVTRLATGIFSRGQKSSDPVDLDSKGGDEIQIHQEDVLETSEGRDYSYGASSQKSIVIDCCETETHPSKEEHAASGTSEMMEAAETLCNLRTEEPDASECEEVDNCSFKRFDIAKDPSDHYYLGTNGQNNGRRWFKKVQQDWSILQNNLPDGIYVRVYEDRMDLLRAVIVGAYGTPYQDGLFFFDFHLPPEYPDVPPDFEELVKEHFRRRGHYILKACDVYMNGYLIGSLTKDASLSDKSEANSTSVGFKLMLAKIVPKLFLALSEVGADCDEFKHLQHSQ